MRFIEMTKNGAWTLFKYKSTHRISWEDCISYVQGLYKHIEHAQILSSAGINETIINIKSAEDIEEIPENMAITIRGFNKVYDEAPFVFTFFNQTDNMFMQMPTAYLNSLRRNETDFLNEEEQKHTFDKFIDSIEVEYVKIATEKYVCKQLREAFFQYYEHKEEGKDILYKIHFAKFNLTEVVDFIHNKEK